MGRKEPLNLIGPKGLDEIISIQMKYAQAFLTYPINYIATHPTQPETVFSNHKLSIQTVPLKHRIPCTGFIIREQPAKRKILAEKIPEHFPIEFYKYLQEGLDITEEETGKVYLNKDYTTEPPASKKIAYCSDTIYDEGLIEHISGADLLYHEATFLHELLDRAKLTYHSTALQTGTLAQKAKVKNLMIGHFSSRYKDLTPLLSEAQAVFQNTVLAEEGKSYEI